MVNKNKRQFFIFLIIVLVKNTSFSQSFGDRQHYFSLTHGFYSQYFLAFNSFVLSEDFENGFFKIYDKQFKYTGPINFKWEYCYSKKIGIGALLGYDQIDLTILDSSKYATYVVKYKVMRPSFAVRVNYHIKIKSKVFDPFIGAAFGANATTFHRTIEENTYGNLFLYSGSKLPDAYTSNNFYVKNPYLVALTVGTRIYLYKGFGLNIEAGWEKSALLLAGIVYKVKK